MKINIKNLEKKDVNEFLNILEKYLTDLSEYDSKVASPQLNNLLG